jgi:hypothetical protein
LTDLRNGNGARDAKGGEAVKDGGAGLNLRDLPIKVTRAEALT